MSQRAAELAKWVRVRAQVLLLERDALAGAAAGSVAPAPAAVPSRRLVLVPIVDHGAGNLEVTSKLKPAKPRPLFVLPSRYRKILLAGHVAQFLTRKPA